MKRLAVVLAMCFVVALAMFALGLAMGWSEVRGYALAWEHDPYTLEYDPYLTDLAQKWVH